MATTAAMAHMFSRTTAHHLTALKEITIRLTAIPTPIQAKEEQKNAVSTTTADKHGQPIGILSM